MGYSGGVDGEFGICFPFRTAKTIADEAEKTIGAAAEEDVSVFGLIGSIWDD